MKYTTILFDLDGTLVNTFWYKGGIDSIQWRQTPDGLLHMDAVMLNDERGHGMSSFLTDESKWTIGLTFTYPEQQVDSIRWIGRGPYRVWRNRLKGQHFGRWSLAYNNTITGDYNKPTPPLYPEFKGYRSDFRWMEMLTHDRSTWRVGTLNEGLYIYARNSQRKKTYWRENRVAATYVILDNECRITLLCCKGLKGTTCLIRNSYDALSSLSLAIALLDLGLDKAEGDSRLCGSTRLRDYDSSDRVLLNSIHQLVGVVLRDILAREDDCWVVVTLLERLERV